MPTGANQHSKSLHRCLAIRTDEDALGLAQVEHNAETVATLPPLRTAQRHVRAPSASAKTSANLDVRGQIRRELASDLIKQFRRHYEVHAPAQCGHDRVGNAIDV